MMKMEEGRGISFRIRRLTVDGGRSVDRHCGMPQADVDSPRSREKEFIQANQKAA